MSDDNKTLAEVQPGGRVRLGDQAERARFEAFLSRNPLTALCAGTAWEVWQAALSAQPSPPTCKEGLQVHPSPGGQGDALKALDDLAAFSSDDTATVDRHVAVIRAALAARLRAEVEAYRKDAERWQHARKLLSVDDIAERQRTLEEWNCLISEDECKRADEAIDAAMGASA